MDEFEIIRRYFTRQTLQRPDVRLGIGDDAAVLDVPPGAELVVTVDTLVAGVHFPENLPAEAVGHRALAVSLSDLAAMGSEPAWALLALTLPKADEEWLEGFSRGLFALADRHQVTLVGGNMAQGPTNISVTLQGFAPQGKALTRSGAQTGDLIYVTGHPGDAAAGLKMLQAGKNDFAHPCLRRFAYPEPRIAAGMALRGIASTAIDVSDGLLADLGHLLEARTLGAKLGLELLPLSESLLAVYGVDKARELALTGGDDYELLFTVHAGQVAAAEARLKELGCPVTCIGAIEPIPGIQCVDAKGREHKFDLPGYKHF
jgi:thiamine-monophosphate kinase